ncbi:MULTISPECIES: hypothetical protein [unclassified Streptomyces]|uniref:hypothetical protein n=1 Tax=unclassified Streptomyces TaxID=2593676 RepID=UPI00278C67D0|nr:MULTISPECIES: hypothetical protein [unclassified Streptomyces]
MADPDGTLPHEAFVDLGGTPAVSVRLFPEDDARITVEGKELILRGTLSPWLARSTR